MPETHHGKNVEDGEGEGEGGYEEGEGYEMDGYQGMGGSRGREGDVDVDVERGLPKDGGAHGVNGKVGQGMAKGNGMVGHGGGGAVPATKLEEGNESHRMRIELGREGAPDTQV